MKLNERKSKMILVGCSGQLYCRHDTLTHTHTHIHTHTQVHLHAHPPTHPHTHTHTKTVTVEFNEHQAKMIPVLRLGQLCRSGRHQLHCFLAFTLSRHFMRYLCPYMHIYMCHTQPWTWGLRLLRLFLAAISYHLSMYACLHLQMYVCHMQRLTFHCFAAFTVSTRFLCYLCNYALTRGFTCFIYSILRERFWAVVEIVCIRIYWYIRVYIHVYIYICTISYIHIRICICVYVQIFVCICMYIYIYIHQYIYIYTYIHIYTYSDTHICVFCVYVCSMGLPEGLEDVIYTHRCTH